MDDPEPSPPPLTEPASARAGSLGLWLQRGASTAFFGRPDWRGLQATPATLAWLVAANLVLAVLVERQYVGGPARF